MSRAAFSVYRRAGSPYYYAKAWDPANARYTSGKSTGKEKRTDAIIEAQQMLEAGDFGVRSKDPTVLTFLADFWQNENRHRGKSRLYLEQSARFVTDYVASYPTFAAGVLLSKVRRADLQRLADYLNEERELTPRMVQRVMQAAKVPLRWAATREMIPRDPTLGLSLPKCEHDTERGILSLEEVIAIADLELPDRNRRDKVILLLAALAGMRRGEIRALQWRDVDFESGEIRIRRNYTDEDGIKTPKKGSAGRVAIYALLDSALCDLRAVSPWIGPKDFVVPNIRNRTAPAPIATIRRAFTRTLDAIGIDETQRADRRLMLHGLRHTFTSMHRLALNDYAAQRLSRHKTKRMMEHYSDHESAIDLAVARDRMNRHFEQFRSNIDKDSSSA